MNNDLISRSELKKCAIPCQIHNGALTDLCVPLYQIDNAPTVEYPQERRDADKSGDLISREALYNEVDTWGCNDYDKYDFLDAIDNAPTVKDLSLEIAQKSIELGRKVRQLEGKLERPQGEWLEWVNEKWGGTTVYCSICKLKALRSSSNDFVMSNFCPNCGADMRGEEWQ